MLRRIEPSDVELGMFIHKLEGSWFSHPFWKRRFVLEDPSDLAALRCSSVAGVVIDDTLGATSRMPDAAASATSPAPAQLAAHEAPLHRNVPSARTGFARAASKDAGGPPPIAREFGAARKIADRSRRHISQAFLKARLGKGVAVGDVEPVVEEIYGTVQRNPYAFSGLLRCQRDKEETYRHALSVCALMIALARRMRLSHTETCEAGMAGLLMDVGVGQLPESLASVEGDYRSLRQQLLDQHVLFGHDMLCVAGDIPEAVLAVSRNHHERMDGSGYPQGLRGEEIDLLSRMAAICDEFDYLVSGGFERPPLDPAAAIEALVAESGTFDPDILRTFIESVGVYPIGAFVRLRSERLAMVVDIDPDDHALPVVRTFHSLASGKPVRGETIRLAQCWGADAIEGIADLTDIAMPASAALQERLLKAACRS
ncbi:HD-GYP domain-containing protein [Pelagerythrobacter sp.]|uniref:HD-GYP domain-containing protein n=1 Tax=Pelagerythrobacter sp. TaxID=2800702 RepID=UPI0035B4F9FB